MKVSLSTFGRRQSVTVDCGGLAPLYRSYSVEQNSGRVVIRIDNHPQPQPILLQLSPDASLIGQGLVTVAGKVQVGSSQHWVPRYDANTPGYWAYSPIYEDRTAQCRVGTMRATGATQTTGGDVNSMLSMFGMQGKQLKVTPGLRLNGQYSAAAGAGIEFDEDSATLHCGSSSTEHAYTIAQTDSGIIVSFDNGTSLLIEPDGRLRANGQNASCNMGTLSPVPH